MIMLKFKSAILVILVVATTYGLPPYIQKCSKSDPKFNECILASAKAALPEIMKGDATLYIPNLSAYDPEDQVLNINENVVYTLKNIKAVSGELVPTSAKMNLNKLTLEIGMHMPFLVWKANFDANGNDFNEHGRVNITFDDLKFDYTKHLEEKEIDGKIYLQIKSETTTGSVKTVELNHVYDEESNVNGQKRIKKLEPKIKDAIEGRLREICGKLVTYIMNTILKSVTKDDVFLE